MAEYKAPLEDIRFVLHNWLKITDHYKASGLEEAADQELVDAILEEGSKFSSEVLAPLNQTGDEEGCTFNDGEVTTPKGFKDAYEQYKANGWPSFAGETEYGGQGLPYSLAVALSEMVTSSNMAWGMYPGLSQGVIEALSAHGTEEQKQTYMTQLISGEWTGTMCLTEPHCGSDLGILRTKADPQDDGSYNITGTKIFISAGEHDLADNIIHLTLARLPDAPEGTKGISLFVVPKFNLDGNGQIADRNTVVCGSIEHKMGIKGSSTAVMNFDSAKGFLVGEPNKGLNYMFTMMNAARLGTGQQGQALAESSYQIALAYAKDRLQMRSLSGPKNPEKAADPIIVHPDVRRMLLSQKAYSEGCRALLYYTATLVDKERTAKDTEERVIAHKELSFLTPICKAFCTELGFEATNHGVQIFGGHGFISEWGMEQFVRDARITQLYEGTNGIQSLDLLGRKVLLDRLETLRVIQAQIKDFTKEAAKHKELKPYAKELKLLVKKWFFMTFNIARSAKKDKEEVGAAAFDYLMYSGYIYLGYIWLQLANTALNTLEAGSKQQKSKLATTKFYFERILPRVKTHAASIKSGADNLMDVDEDLF
ncbi:acyl-CoA dehydrogenase C-terminal domain-containing protein [Pleionea sp. CnH1-48]|uniref:acyl-CoA dehydrogenase C-terminal domain-containing protein n=1 Tax=Pleionea sp. CnH1-48 TaxID=2954494 RepID=UPI0020974EDE|nr:acyl-CoA dehydrogenase C-terminal domain-containing protein [Pleionea sp. CnH1-48]MCO7223005.1 acyl-CoA dehydrogenase C-terminal domain-containing protein [Pleionea sp. CnH1-48]